MRFLQIHLLASLLQCFVLLAHLLKDSLLCLLKCFSHFSLLGLVILFYFRPDMAYLNMIVHYVLKKLRYFRINE